jgi:transcriptional regulator with XRE-family HTH domain
MTDTLNPDTLKVLRDLRGWSQDRLAKESKISKSQISRWERGQQTAKIHQNTRERLCQALGVKWDKLTRAVEMPNPYVFRAPLKAGISFPGEDCLDPDLLPLRAPGRGRPRSGAPRLFISSRSGACVPGGRPWMRQ